MKLLNKIFAVLLILMLAVSFTACGGKKDNDSTPSENSNPTNSTPSESTPVDTNSTDDKKEDSEPEESKPQTSTPSETVKPQKDYAKLIVGNWSSKIDACEILAEYEYEFNGPIYINFITIFGNDNSYTECINDAEATSALKSALGDDYDDNFIANCVNTLSDALFATGVYKFENNVLSIKMDGLPEYTDVDYSFKSDTKLVLSVMSDELEFTKK